MAFGRWMNPERVKVYARPGIEEYCKWMDKIMAVRHIDATRTTNLPCMEAGEALEGWHEQLERPMEPDVPTEPSPPFRNGTRISVYWTEMNEWYHGDVTSSRLETGDDGRPQRATRI
eukprot:2744993-Prymnesium_polylepis.2